jgi:D-glycero-alpha-D-manno-heptose-7-phosphate kinase
VSTTIDKYFYVFVSLNSPDSVQISSSDYRALYRHQAGQPPLWEGDLALVRAALHEFGFEGGLSLFLASEVPPGSGLGSSSAVAVALVKTLATLGGLSFTLAELSERACTLELERLGSPIGKQDQYAAAFGGLNAITFTRSGVVVEPLAVSVDTRERLHRNLLLFFTGATRSANSILHHQQRASADNQSEPVAALHAIKAMAGQTRRCLEKGDTRGFGEILAESWNHKKRLAPDISNPRIDEFYELARRHGALGGKLTGAGGGGFLVLYCEEPCQAPVSQALERAGLYRMDYQFEQAGAQVLVNAFPRTACQWSARSGKQLQHA